MCTWRGVPVNSDGIDRVCVSLAGPAAPGACLALLCWTLGARRPGARGGAGAHCHGDGRPSGASVSFWFRRLRHAPPMSSPPERFFVLLLLLFKKPVPKKDDLCEGSENWVYLRQISGIQTLATRSRTGRWLVRCVCLLASRSLRLPVQLAGRNADPGSRLRPPHPCPRHPGKGRLGTLAARCGGDIGEGPGEAGTQLSSTRG